MVGGISAGANFSSILAHLARDDKLLPPLTGTYLSIPAVIPKELVPEKYKDVFLSMEQNIDAPVLNRDAMLLFESKLSQSRFQWLVLIHLGRTLQRRAPLSSSYTHGP